MNELIAPAIGQRPVAPRRVILDLDRLSIGPDGVESLSWPLARDEIEKVRDAFLSHLIAAARARLATGDQRARQVDILALRWTMTVMGMFQACALLERFARAGTEPDVSSHYRYLGPLLAGREPGPEDYVRRIVSGPPTSSRWRAMLRDARYTLVDEEIRHRSFWRATLRDANVSIQTGPLISLRARSADRPVYYLPHSVWHRAVGADELQREIQTLVDVVAMAIEAAEAAFSNAGVRPPDYALRWMTEQFSMSLAATEIHLRRLLAAPERLPVRLWTGAAGNPFTRLLRRAVKLKDGTVTGHDHGSGSGIFVETQMPLLEFTDCDHFVTFSAHEASTLRRNQSVDWMITPHVPNFIVAAPSSGSRILAAKPIHKAQSIKHSRPVRVLYMDPGLGGDRVRFWPLRSDPIAVDWMARVFGMLRSWGYSATYKVHPEFPVPVPRRLTEQFGVRLLTTRFEQIFHEYDLILFDDPHTTTFPVSLASDKDMVLIDTGFMPWKPGVRELLNKRCPVVSTWFDQDNRQQIDWDKLKEALEAAKLHHDPEFFETYFGSQQTNVAAA